MIDNQEKNQDHDRTNYRKKKLYFRLSVLFVYFIILLYLFFFLTHNLSLNPFIVFLILLFLFLVVIGPVFSGLKRSMYSEMYKNKKGKLNRNYRRSILNKKETNATNTKNRKVNLNVKYRKPIIRNCYNCGMIVANFVTKCPQCGKSILD